MSKKKKTSLLIVIADKIVLFIGSWWGVFFHLIWWLVWFVLKFNIHVLTLWLSIEAILICIFILMVQNKAEEERKALFDTYNKSEMKTLERDVKLAERGDRRQLEIMRAMRLIQTDLIEIKKQLTK